MNINAFIYNMLLRATLPVRPIKTRRLEDYDFLPDKASGGILELADCLVAPKAGGIHDVSGRPILESYLQRGATETPIYPFGKPEPFEISPNDPVDHLETAIVLPPLIVLHYGHRLTETAGWVSAILDPDTKLLEHIESGTPVIMMGKGEFLNRSRRGLMRVFDIPENRIVLAKDISRPIRCKKILLPQPTMVDCRAMDKKHVQAASSIMDRWYGIDSAALRKRMKNVAAGNDLPSDKIYLSRAKLPNTLRKIIGEENIEKELARRGWKIIHPETLSIEDQILALHHARIIAGSVSSGFHTLLYLGDDAKGKTVIGLGTDRVENERYCWIYNFVHQFRVQGIRFWHLSCMEFDDSSMESKFMKTLRFNDLKPLYGSRRIAREMDRIANRLGYG